MEDFITQTVMPLLQVGMTTFISLILAIGAFYLKQKFNINIKASNLEYLEDLASQLVLKSEGRAERYLMEKGKKLTGSMKHANAVNAILASAPDLTHEEAKHLIDMAVARIPGIGKVGIQ